MPYFLTMQSSFVLVQVLGYVCNDFGLKQRALLMQPKARKLTFSAIRHATYLLGMKEIHSIELFICSHRSGCCFLKCCDYDLQYKFGLYSHIVLSIHLLFFYPSSQFYCFPLTKVFHLVGMTAHHDVLSMFLMNIPCSIAETC